MAIDDKKLLDSLTRVSKLINRAQGEGSGSGKRHGRGGRGGHGPGSFGGGYPTQDPFARMSGFLGAFEGQSGHGSRRGGKGGKGGKGKWDKGFGPDHDHEGGRAGQERILSMLAVKDGLSQKYLAYLLGIRPQTLSEALAKLEEQGYVERKKDENDRRVTLVYLTDEGRKRAEEIDARRERKAEDISSVLTEEEKEQLASILAKLDASIEQQEGQCADDDDADEDSPDDGDDDDADDDDEDDDED